MTSSPFGEARHEAEYHHKGLIEVYAGVIQ